MATTTTTTTPGAYDWIAQLLTGGANLATAHGDMTAAHQASNMADPWAPNRGRYADMLNQFMGTNAVNPAASTARSAGAYDQLQNLLANPQSLTSMPGYQYGLNQSLEAVNRGAGASGMLNSGNRLTALQDRGEGYARDWQKQMFQELLGNVGAANATDALGLNAQQQGFGQLAGLAGVNAGSPGLAAQMLLGGRQNQANSIGAGVGGIANGLGGGLQAIQRLLGGGGSSLLDFSGNSGAGVDANFLENLFPGGSSGDIFAGLNLDPGADWGALFGGFGGP